MGKYTMTKLPVEEQMIPENTRGILYLCKLYETEIKIETTLFFESSFDAFEAYANIPNPESQLVTGNTYDEVYRSAKALQLLMADKSWLEMLHNSI